MIYLAGSVKEKPEVPSANVTWTGGQGRVPGRSEQQREQIRVPEKRMV
jgi:hypothetical protein